MPQTKMHYRRLGRSGLQLSVLSFGSWVTFDNQLKDDLALDCMQAAHDAGCNFFDNAEAYAGGESEAIMGRVIEQLGWKRQSYVLSTKFFWGIDGNMPNMRNTLNRKYLHHAIEGCLDRLRVDFVDLLFCHRADPDTPIEETVWAMRDLDRARQGAVLGHQRVEGRRDPRRVGDRRAAPPAQAGDGAAAVQPARAHQGRGRVRPPVRRHRPRAPRSGARWRADC